jgi:hypothetical protein
VRVTEQGTTLRVEATWTVLAPTAGRFEAHLADGLDVASVDVDGRPWGASLGTVERQGGLDASFSLLPGVGTMHLPDALDLADVPRGAALFDGRWYASGAPFHVGPRRVGSYASEGVLMTARAAVGVTVGDAEIAVEGQPVARFLMRPKPEKTCLAMQALELLHGLATPQQQTPSTPAPLRLQVPERFGDEAGVRRIPLG